MQADSAKEAAGAGSTSSALAALAVLATRLGFETDVETLRRRFSLEPGEPSTSTLVAIAREIGLEAQSLHIPFAELPKLAKTLPAILQARNGGALILEEARSDPMKGSVAVVRDPAASEDELVAIEEVRLAEVWDGEVILLKRARISAARCSIDISSSWGVALAYGSGLATLRNRRKPMVSLRNLLSFGRVSRPSATR